MSKKNYEQSQKARKPVYRLFNSKVLNDKFCPTEEAAKAFVELTVKEFDEWFGAPEVIGMRNSRITAFVMAHMETAFVMGWCEAMKAMKSNL